MLQHEETEYSFHFKGGLNAKVKELQQYELEKDAEYVTTQTISFSSLFPHPTTFINFSTYFYSPCFSILLASLFSLLLYSPYFYSHYFSIIVLLLVFLAFPPFNVSHYFLHRELRLSSSTSFEGSSLGDSFYSTNEWTISNVALFPSSCVVRVLVKNEYRGRMFKGLKVITFNIHHAY
jgi:hypothetical protein